MLYTIYAIPEIKLYDERKDKYMASFLEGTGIDYCKPTDLKYPKISILKKVIESDFISPELCQNIQNNLKNWYKRKMYISYRRLKRPNHQNY